MIELAELHLDIPHLEIFWSYSKMKRLRRVQNGTKLKKASRVSARACMHTTRQEVCTLLNRSFLIVYKLISRISISPSAYIPFPCVLTQHCCQPQAKDYLYCNPDYIYTSEIDVSKR
jgi:hypothetical protein